MLMAIAVCVDSPSGRVPLINLRLPLIVAARYKNMGGGGGLSVRCSQTVGLYRA